MIRPNRFLLEQFMPNIEELNSADIDQVVGGTVPHSEIDPQTGEIVYYDCTGREIGRGQN